MQNQRIGDHFLAQPKLTPLPDGIHWVLDEQLDYWMNDENGSAVISIEKGFVTDFTSSPSSVWGIVPPWGKYGNGAILHDWLYGNTGIVPLVKDGVTYSSTFTRADCDRIFLDAMEALGVGWLKRHLIYWALRPLGGFAWSADAKHKNHI